MTSSRLSAVNVSEATPLPPVSRELAFVLASNYFAEPAPAMNQLACTKTSWGSHAMSDVQGACSVHTPSPSLHMYIGRT